MSVGYGYVISGMEMGHGAKGDQGCEGDGVADDVDAVCALVTRAIHRHYEHRGPDALARVLTAYWGPLRHQLLTTGVSATQSAAKRWEGSAGPITVKLWCL
jgi:hypothetical protein